MPRLWRRRNEEGMALKWLLVLVSVLVLAFAVAACGDDDDEGGGGGSDTAAEDTGGGDTDKPVNIAFLVATEAAGYPQGMIAAAEEKAQEVNATVEVFDAQFNPQKQVSQCQDAIAGGKFDAIVALPAASPPMVACAAQAAAKKIPLISTNTPIGDDLASGESQVPGVTSQVLVPAETAFGAGPDGGAGQLVPGVCEAAGGESCKIAFIIGVRALALTQVADQNMKEVVAGIDGAELVGTCEGGYQRAGGLKCMQDLLQKDPDINVLISLSDDMALGAEGAIKKAGKTPGKDIFIGTQGASVVGIDNIRSGKWFGSILSLAEPEGAIPIELAAKAARGEDVEPYVNPNEATGNPLVFDQNNKDEYPDLVGQFDA
jgi:ribose transport system substrate-binding protein